MGGDVGCDIGGGRATDGVRAGQHGGDPSPEQVFGILRPPADDHPQPGLHPFRADRLACEQTRVRTRRCDGSFGYVDPLVRSTALRGPAVSGLEQHRLDIVQAEVEIALHEPAGDRHR